VGVSAMMYLHDEVFFRTNTIVCKDDEFYQVILENYSDAEESVFQVKVFHGFAGNPPKKPVSNEFFGTKDAAETKFHQIVARLEWQGFCPYSLAIHGADRSF
jgi:hypothetical protein